MIDRFTQPFTLIIGPIYFIFSIIWGHWLIAGILLVWWHFSRGIKLYPHLKNRPSDISILPFYIFTTYLMAVMKIYAITDTHTIGNLEKALTLAKKEKVDYILHLGDITNFGSKLKEAISLLDSASITTFMVPGNHEDGTDIKDLCNKTDNVLHVHKATQRMGKILFIFFGHEWFEKGSKDFDKFVSKMKGEIKKGDKLILCTHAPPFNTKLDDLPQGHVGIKSYRKFIEVFKPIFAFSGHLHETFYVDDKIGKTILINPGPQGMLLEIK